ncbi:MAG: hypothetical protein IPL01_20230 [Acidobacteria bacterium]|nr:hypothetical protein [Acidobacteriota bacterium]
MSRIFLIVAAVIFLNPAFSFQRGGSSAEVKQPVEPAFFKGLRYRSIGPHRGGRVTAITGGSDAAAYFLYGRDGRRRLEDDRCGTIMGQHLRRIF